MPGLAVASVILLTAASCALLFSAASQGEVARYDDAFHTVYRQLGQAAAGLIVLALLALLPVRRLRKLAPWGVAGGLLMAVLPFVPALGIRSGGAVRQFSLGALRWEPGQILVVTLLVWTASVLVRRPLGQVRRFVSVGIVAAGLLISMLQPDFSLLPLILVPVAMQAWLSGVRGRRALQLVIAVTVVVVGAAVVNPYIGRRVDGWMRPQATAHEAGRDYVLLQRGVSSAGALGAGYGKGRHVVRTGEAKSDYLFAHAVEELGFLRAFGLLMLYLPVLLLGIRAVFVRGPTFAGLVGVGMAGYILTAVGVHAAVNLRLVPVTAIHLPFLSFGGASLVASMAALGLLIAVNREPEAKPSAAKVESGVPLPAR